MITRRVFGGLTAGMLGSAVLPRNLLAAADFYSSGSPISALIGITPGAGSDISARYIVDFLSKHTAGNPPIIVQNIPGAASMLAGNQFALRPHDGYTMFVLSSNGLINWLMGNEKVEYDLTNVVPIISVPGESFLSISSSTGYEKPSDLLNKDLQLIMGGGSVSAGHVRLVMALEILGIADKVQFVWGYGGGGETMLAFQRGEVTLCSQTVAGYLHSIVPLEKTGEAKTLFQLGELDNKGNMVRSPEFPDVPTVRDLYVELYDKEPSGPLYDSFKVFGGLVNSMLTSLVLPDDAPAEAIAALREGAVKAAQDPEFMKNAEAVLGTKQIIVGDALDAQVQLLKGIKKETMMVVRKLATEKYGAKGLRLE